MGYMAQGCVISLTGDPELLKGAKGGSIHPGIKLRGIPPRRYVSSTS